MPSAIISHTVEQPTTAEIRQFVFNGDFTSGAGITVHVTLDLKNNDGSLNRTMIFILDNASAGQKNHFADDVAAAMNTINAKIEAILGVTFA